MRRVIVYTEMSLDGVLEHPEEWVFDYQNDETNQFFRQQFLAADGLLMGRVTYAGFAEFWPTLAGTDDIADRMNSLPKFVASRTLTEPLQWNASLLQGEAGEAVARLKVQPGQNLLQFGIGELTQTLLQRGLIDALHLLVYPVLVGRGARIFEGVDKTGLKLVETKTFSTGVVALHYQPARQD